MRKQQKGFGVLELIIILVIAGIIAAVGWFALSQRSGDSTSSIIDSLKSSDKDEPPKLKNILVSISTTTIRLPIELVIFTSLPSWPKY